MNKKQKAFTLIELSVTMAIIAVLAVLLIGAIRAAVAARARSAHLGNARTIETSLEAYAGVTGGSYCGVNAVAGGQTINNPCGGPFDLVAVGDVLDGTGTSSFLSQNVDNAGCNTAGARGGGAVTFNATGASYDMTVFGQDCVEVYETIRH